MGTWLWKMLQNFPQNIWKTNYTKHFINLEDIFKLAKNFSERRNPKKNSSKTAVSKVLGKISIRKKILKQQTQLLQG